MRHTQSSGDLILSLTIIFLLLGTVVSFLSAAVVTVKGNYRSMRFSWGVCIVMFLLLGLVCAIPASQA